MLKASQRDGVAYRILNADATSPAVFLCDHATNFIPPEYDGLGLPSPRLEEHIAYDIGIESVTERLAEHFGFTTVLSCFSRLLVDPNRKQGHSSLVPLKSGGVAIPANQGLTGRARQERLDRFYHPYHRAVREVLAQKRSMGSIPLLLSLHSMTHEMEGVIRPWPLCALWNEDARLPLAFIDAVQKRGQLCGDNVPYDGRDGHGFTTEVHGDANGYANVIVEVRQDLIKSSGGIKFWADFLCDVFAEVLERPDLNRLFDPRKDRWEGNT